MKLIDKNLNEKWYDESAEGSPIFLSLPAQAICLGMTPVKRQYHLLLTFYKQGEVKWRTLVKDQDRIFEEILAGYFKNPKLYQSWFKKWREKTKEFRVLYDKISKFDLSRLSQKGLFDLHNSFWSKILICRRISMIIDPFIFGSERRLIRELEKYQKKGLFTDINKVYLTLLPQPKETLFNKFERDLMELARQIKVKQIPFSEYQNLFLFQKHLIKYAWIKNSWGAKNDYTATILKKEIEGLLKKKSTLSKDSQNKIFTKNQDRRKAIIKKYAFNKTIRAISDLSTLFSLWLDLRKENALKFVEIEDKFLKEFSVRFKLDYKVLHLFDITEIEKAVKNRQFFKDQARKRQSLFMLIHTQKRVSALFGKKVRGYLDKLAIPVKFKRVGEINGISAMPGRVRGRIKIIHHQNQFKKFRTNDILVTGMTRPDFINIMKKAKAIVTDDGGLTCHAAIISRELKIPCIISTKIATKVLKDGMMVEVDANKGVVKKVKITK